MRNTHVAILSLELFQLLASLLKLLLKWCQCEKEMQSYRVSTHWAYLSVVDGPLLVHSIGLAFLPLEVKVDEAQLVVSLLD